MTREELARQDGRDGRPAWVAVNGKVYDFTESKMWRAGSHAGRHPAGSDLSAELAQAPHVRAVIERFPVVGELVEAAPAKKGKPWPFLLAAALAILALIYFFARLNRAPPDQLRLRRFARVKPDQRRPPAAGVLSRLAERSHLRQAGEQGMHAAQQLPRPLAVDDAHLQDLPPAAFAQIIGEQRFQVARVKGVQVEDAVDGQDDFFGEFFVHGDYCKADSPRFITRRPDRCLSDSNNPREMILSTD